MALLLLALFALVGPASVETAHVKVKASTGAPTGGRIPLFLDVEPKPTMHVYAPGQDGFIVVSLTLEEGKAIAAGPPKFPTPEKIVFEPLNETQLVYAKPFRIVQQIQRP